MFIYIVQFRLIQYIAVCQFIQFLNIKFLLSIQLNLQFKLYLDTFSKSFLSQCSAENEIYFLNMIIFGKLGKIINSRHLNHRLRYIQELTKYILSFQQIQRCSTVSLKKDQFSEFFTTFNFLE
ncbi:unnamed protein product (macronuclear) [Paramecium tetraurelia]|uniref:Transmembrane protein n=1 Tax=Paramecium tetraurelia TaxID=5888 RepID=A0CJC2_PARTE|nr:uncharacterized protein GSPATT00000600001 [Paramecium tetraurelia]CAK70889.1 unnamed protein product [Paramecium tetraurelia]|eukprot:XP_001438286.1 hypothetical protein (macronuclear) [Paramecium tetraurelia strain d4-2]